MKLKKLLTALFALVIMVPVAFLCTACGAGELDTKVTLNTNGNYEEVTAEAYATAFEQLNNSTEGKFGYKMSGTEKMEMELDEDLTMTMDCDFVVIMTCDEEGEVTGMAMKMNTKTTMGEETEEGKVELYVTDGYAYMHVSGTLEGEQVDEKMKFAIEEGVSLDEAFDDMEYSMDLGEFGMYISPSFLDELGEGFKFEKAVDGTTTKFKVTNEELNAEAFLILDDGNFAGMSVKIEGLEYGFGMKIDLDLQAKTFDGTIPFPSFEGYEEVA